MADDPDMPPPLPDRENLLPGDATPLERAIADTDGRLDDIDTDLPRRVGGPIIAEVPARFLPHRAWQASVDVWDPAWPEAVQRAVIQAAPEVHRIKGTPASLDLALAALGIDATIVQWWETEPKGTPYTFKVTIEARSPLYASDFHIDPRLVKVAFATVMRTKPLTRAFDLSVEARFHGRPGLAAIGVGRTRFKAVVRPSNRIAASAGVGLAAISVGRTRFKATLQPNANA